MKKIVLFISVISLITSCSKDSGGGGNNVVVGPQITDTAIRISFAPGKVTQNYVIDSTNTVRMLKGWPVARGTDISWDFSSANTSNTFTDSIKTSNGIYTNATYMLGFNMNFLGRNLNLNRYFSVNNNNWLNLGYYLGVPLSIPIDANGGAISVPIQKPEQTPSLINANFPITYGDSIPQVSTNTIKAFINGSFEVQILPAPQPKSTITLNNEQLNATLTSTVASKNIAYGKLKIAGYPNDLDVVVQKFTVTETTNLSFPNSPIYNSGIDLFLAGAGTGIKNGQSVTTTTYRFWAKGKGLVMRIEQNGQAFVRTDL